MGREIQLLKHHTDKQNLQSEWTQQLLEIEHTLNFFETYFLWSTQQLSSVTIASLENDVPDILKFYEIDAPMVLTEAREALRLLLYKDKKKDSSAK